jgi:quercetin dioxygenase-like cupin family protein
MTLRISRRLAAPLFSVAFLLSITAAAADTPPDKPIGLTGSNDPVGTVDLAPHNLAGSPGDYELRARTIVVAPGGATQNHPHAGRPGIVRVIKGTIIEYRGSAERTVKAGDYWFENADTTHWFRNPSSTEPAEIWAVDLVPKKK